MPTETVEDIVRDMRERASVALRQDEDAMVHHSAIGNMINDFADRIYAANKREVADLKGRLGAIVVIANGIEAENKREVNELTTKLDTLKKAMNRVCSINELDEIDAVEKEIQGLL